jgi:hypothetical protein
MLLAKLIIMNDTIEFWSSPGGFFQGTPEELNELAVCANSPWSYKNEVYEITCDEDSFEWICQYQVVGYDGITSIIYGYGHTPKAALINCIDTFDKLQSEYNNDGVCF